MRKRSIVLALCMTVVLGTGAWAAYPEKPVTIIVPSKAGGGTDTMARLVAQFIEPYLGQSMVIVNKPGAGGQIGFEAIARVKKDGYTIGCLYTPHVVAHISSGRAKYTLDSFAPLANVVTDPGVLVVKADSPFATLKDVVDHAKANPGALTSSTSGPGGDDDFARRQFEEAAAIKLNAVPSKGSSGQKAALMGGHVDMAFMNASQVDAQVRSGELRILGIMTRKRRSYLAEIPTFLELGYNVLSDSSRGFAAPAGIPQAAMEKLLHAFNEVLKDPKFIKAAQGQLLLDVLDDKLYGQYLNELKQKTDAAFKTAPW
ncbi:MAG: recombinase RecA [Dethiosulfovibrio peptidovorans]|nr:MAG: recombinase RecA [Dethiosulfovibrio peptidovorans]